jgi:predicted PurR-regulated permease PerM
MNTIRHLTFSLVIAILLYYILDAFSVKKPDSQNESQLKKIITFSVLWVVSFVFVYFMNNAFGTSGGSLEGPAQHINSMNQSYEVQMIKNISENIRTGFPPF